MSKSMYDAAYPPAHPPATDVVAGYIGGDTPHVWTDAEWHAQHARFRLPVFVRSNPGSHDPHTDAALAIKWLRGHNFPRGRVVGLDLETAVNGFYVRAFDADIKAAGYLTMAYGSVSTIFSNPRPSGGYWVAHYTGHDHMEPGAVATQWTNDQQLGKPWDLSTVSDSVPLWDTHSTPQLQQEVDVIARDVLEGLGNKTQFPMKPGSCTTVVAYTDNSYENETVKATGPVTLRFAVKHNDGSGYQTVDKTVGRVGTDSSKEYVSFSLDNAAHAVAVSVTRQSGDGTEPLTVGAY